MHAEPFLRFADICPAFRRPVPDALSQGIRRKSLSAAVSASPDRTVPPRRAASGPVRFFFGGGSGGGRPSGVRCSCTAFHAAPVIEEQVRMACGSHSSCLFETGPADGIAPLRRPVAVRARTARRCAVRSGGRRFPLPLPEGAQRLCRRRVGRDILRFSPSPAGAVGARPPIPIPSDGCGSRRCPPRRVRDGRDRSFRRLRRNDRDRKSQAEAPRPPRRPDPRSSCKAG